MVTRERKDLPPAYKNSTIYLHFCIRNENGFNNIVDKFWITYFKNDTIIQNIN